MSFQLAMVEKRKKILFAYCLIDQLPEICFPILRNSFSLREDAMHELVNDLVNQLVG